MKILKAPDYQGMCRKAAHVLFAQVVLFPGSVIGLATGSTPLGVYEQLVDWYGMGDIDFSRVRTVNLDEYYGLSPDHPQSYAHYMRENLFDRVNISRDNTHLPNGLAKDVEEECARYDRLIQELGGIDMQLLGIGHNGHIGFNEPGQAFGKVTHCVALNERTIEANARFFDHEEQVPRRAISMGMKAIMQAKKILLVVNGEDKAEILSKALGGPVTPAVPASILQLHPDVTVVADEKALMEVRNGAD